MNPITQLDVYKVAFMAALLLAEFLFLFRRRKKPHFWIRQIACWIICLTAAILIPVVEYSSLYVSSMFFCLIVISGVLHKFCYDESWMQILFCICAAYSTEHLASSCFSLLTNVTGINNIAAVAGFGGDDITWEIYGSGDILLTEGFNEIAHFIIYAVYVAFYFGAYSLSFGAVYGLFANRLKTGEEIRFKGNALFGLALVIVISEVILHAVFIYYSYQTYDETYVLIELLYNILCCIVVLILQFSVMDSAKLKGKLDVVEYLLREQKKQYALSKENISLLNEKCHDLKHQISKWEINSVNGEAVSEAKRTISIYDSGIQTENEALNVVLTEKKIFCAQNDVRMTCILDGSKLSFISENDIYSLFGNALDNAIEAVMQISDKEKRVISVNIKKINDFVSVVFRNYYEGKIIFEDGVPKTKKKDERYHGYGVKSVLRITEKYGGSASIQAEDGIFCLNLLFSR